MKDEEKNTIAQELIRDIMAILTLHKRTDLLQDPEVTKILFDCYMEGVKKATIAIKNYEKTI